MPSTLQPLDSFEVPRFSGLATFLRTPYVPDAEGIDVALVGVPFDFNLSRNGTRFGPSHVREMSRLIRRFPAGGGESPFDLCNVADVGDAPVNPLEIQASVDMIAAYFARLAAKRVAVVAMGGDHGVSYPVWKGLAQPGRPFGVVHFDAHPDTYHQLFGNRYNQGTMLRRGVEEGLIDPKRLVSIGFRGTRFALDDRDFNHETGMRTIDMDEFERIGREATIEEARRVIGERPHLRDLRRGRPRSGLLLRHRRAGAGWLEHARCAGDPERPRGVQHRERGRVRGVPAARPHRADLAQRRQPHVRDYLPRRRYRRPEQARAVRRGRERMKNGVVAELKENIERLPEGAQRKLLGDNAVEVYRLD